MCVCVLGVGDGEEEAEMEIGKDGYESTVNKDGVG